MPLLNNPVAVMFLSFIIGVIADLALRRMPFYGWLSELYLFSNPKMYERLGIERYRKILLATPLRMFNTNIKIPKNRDLRLVKEIRQHIATAEVSHWVGFIVMLVVTFFAWNAHGLKTGIGFVLFNIIGNLYPCLLQQYNKKRLYQLIALMERRI